MDKTQIRQQMRKLRQNLSSEQQQLAATQLGEIMATLDVFKACKRFACYLANDGEIDPLCLIHDAMTQHKHCYLPILGKNDVMRFARYFPGCDTHLNRYGIDEPITEDILSAGELDLILLPLVAFDLRGNRLGRGKGYYDRTLAQIEAPKPFLMGLAHTFQQVDNLPHDEWDIALNALCTDQQYFTL